MSKIFKLGEISQKEEQFEVSAYSGKSSENLARLAGLKDFNLNIRTLKSGRFSCPYHFHHNAEEMFFILSGSGELRVCGEKRTVETGDVLMFEKGETGAHQLYNNGNIPLVYMDLKTNNEIDICEYPDSGKVNILPQEEIFSKGEKMDYFDGEEDVRENWKNI